MMDFLYFPDDKTEYIPSVIMLFVFVLGAVIFTIWIKRHSAKELSKWENDTNEFDTEEASHEHPDDYPVQK